jgi:MoxR-like ATPase
MGSNEDIKINTIKDKERLLEIRRKMKLFIQTCEESLLERDELIRLILLAVLSKEHLFMYGPPGSAKSDASKTLQKLTKSRKFFRYLMTEFTKYEEIFGEEVANKGMISKRIIDRKLPTAENGFIDEIFKGNSEILNAMLTILNERIFDDGYNGTIDVPLYTVLAASNEFPRSSYLKALFERFVFRIPVPNVKEFKNRVRLLNDDLEKLGDIDELTKDDIDFVQSNFKELKFSDENALTLNTIVDTLHQLLNSKKDNSIESYYEISGRTLFKVGKILRLSAYVNNRTHTDTSDLLLLRYIVWNNLSERERVIKKLSDLLFGSESEFHGDIIKELDKISSAILRYQSSMYAKLSFNDVLQTEDSYKNFYDYLQNFYDDFKEIDTGLKLINNKLQDSKQKEKLVENNIFLKKEKVLIWTVDQSNININSEKFKELTNIVFDFNNFKVENKNNLNLFKMVSVLDRTFEIVNNLKRNMKVWLDEYDTYFAYRLKRDSHE